MLMCYEVMMTLRVSVPCPGALPVSHGESSGHGAGRGWGGSSGRTVDAGLDQSQRPVLLC